jgi:hypothetical protein
MVENQTKGIPEKRKKRKKSIKAGEEGGRESSKKRL